MKKYIVVINKLWARSSEYGDLYDPVEAVIVEAETSQQAKDKIKIKKGEEARVFEYKTL